MVADAFDDGVEGEELVFIEGQAEDEAGELAYVIQIGGGQLFEGGHSGMLSLEPPNKQSGLVVGWLSGPWRGVLMPFDAVFFFPETALILMVELRVESGESIKQVSVGLFLFIVPS